MPKKCETPRGGGASRNSCGGYFRDPLSHPPLLLQLPPIIARHVWWPDELAVIEAAAMVALALIGGSSNG